MSKVGDQRRKAPQGASVTSCGLAAPTPTFRGIDRDRCHALRITVTL